MKLPLPAAAALTAAARAHFHIDANCYGFAFPTDPASRAGCASTPITPPGGEPLPLYRLKPALPAPGRCQREVRL